MLRQRAIQAEDKEERRHAILDAAERLLLRQVDRVPAVSEVADEAGLAKGTVYLYFGSKEELFLALHDRAVDAFFSDIGALLEGAPAVRFEDVFAVTRRHMVDAPLFLPLASRCFASMDNDLSPAAAAGFRERMGARLLGAGERIERRFLLPTGEGVVLLRHSYALIMGLWQMKSAQGSLCPASIATPSTGVEPAAVKRIDTGTLAPAPRMSAGGGARRRPGVSPVGGGARHPGAASRPGGDSPFLWDYGTELEGALRALWVGRIAAGRAAGVRRKSGFPA